MALRMPPRNSAQCRWKPAPSSEQADEGRRYQRRRRERRLAAEGEIRTRRASRPSATFAVVLGSRFRHAGTLRQRSTVKSQPGEAAHMPRTPLIQARHRCRARCQGREQAQRRYGSQRRAATDGVYPLPASSSRREYPRSEGRGWRGACAQRHVPLSAEAPQAEAAAYRSARQRLAARARLVAARAGILSP